MTGMSSVDDVNKQVPNVVVYRFICIVFGMSSSQILLNATTHREEQCIMLSD